MRSLRPRPDDADWQRAEAERLRWRRNLLGQPAAAPRAGLALSGGGIRSATISLGMLQALARRGRLESFDYLSTVSGGGYTGSFVGSLFTPKSVRNGATVRPSNDEMMSARDEALRQLAAVEQRADPIGPARAGEARAIEWLRDSGRYLAPNGGGDYFFMLVLWLRNVIAVHYVIAISLVLPLALLAVLNLALTPALAGGLPALPGAWGAGALYFWLALAVALVAVLPLGVGYWCTELPTRAGASAWGRWGAGLLTRSSILAFVAGPVIAGAGWGQRWAMWAVLAGAVAWLGWLWFAIGWTRGVLAPEGGSARETMRVTRTRLTQWLARATGAALSLLAIALVLVAATAVLRWVESRQGVSGISVGAFAAVLLSLQKFWSSGAAPAPDAGARRALMRLAPLLLALLLGLWLLLMWGVAAVWLGGGELRRVPWPALLGLLLLGLITGVTFQFLNLSTLQNLYTARIVRAYLGASNAARADSTRGAAITEAHPRDDMTLDQYYGRAGEGPTSLAPLHLINVTINDTVVSEQALVYQDRKGLPMAVTPEGYLVDGHLRSRGDAGPGGFERLSLGRWIGISGAAFAPGLGRGTTPERALLAVLLNMRLGYWWRAAATRARDLGAWAFATQVHLYRELRGQFFGTSQRFWYLTDGGHFDNTAVYELLRRRVGFILALDNGADPDYQFGDVANLMRLARVDFGAVFEPLVPPAALVDLFGNPGGFERGARQGQQFLLGYRVALPAAGDVPAATCTLVFVKPRLTQHASLDLVQYQATYPDFPQQSTTDQFFDDAQWESYRKLGFSLGQALLERLPSGADPWTDWIGA
ncbi:MAG TPA: patatin-like phospholipase family protein [Ottowia sp.]|nr:patatin-like phospholipase family protein [Ottowia sp.]